MCSRSSCSSLAVALVLAAAVPGVAAPKTPAESAQKTEAAAISRVAASKAKAGEFLRAAELYHEAFRIDPATLGYLYSAARAEELAGQTELAERDFVAFIDRAPRTDPLVPDAARHLADLRMKRPAAPLIVMAPGEVTPTAVPPPVASTPTASLAPPRSAMPVVVAAVPSSWQRPAGIASTAGGALALLGAFFVYQGASDRAADLKAALQHTDTDGFIDGLSYADAKVKAREIGTRRLGAAALGGLGLAGVGLGAYWLATAPTAPVTVVPRPGGVAVSGRF